MQLSADDLKTVATAKRNERFWKYGRFLELLFAVGVIWLTFWLIGHPEFSGDGFERYLPPALAGMGGGYLGALIRRWTSKERQLLIRLAANASPGTD